jgi:RNase P/RNase MRP subunit POP5
MVKFKSRYFLIENLFEEDKIRTIEPQKMLKILRTEVEQYFGDIGVGKLNKNLQVKYVNNMTNLMIIRVGKEYCKLVTTVLNLINQIEGDKIRLHILAISGTIKKCEIKAKRFLESWKLNYEKLNN